MSNSSILSQKHMDPLGMIEQFWGSPDSALEDKDPNKDNECSLTAKESTSTPAQIDSMARSFPRFSELPPQVRTRIWRMAWLTRPVLPFDSKPTPKFNVCNSSQGCELCKFENFRARTRAPAIMYVCREARREAQRIARPLSTWSWELELPRGLSRAWSKAQFEKFWDEVCYRDEMLRTITWFNPAADFVVLGPESILRMSEQVGPPNRDDVLQAALDPALVLMLCPTVFGQHEKLEAEFEALRFGLRSLYNQYLKPRDHIYICEGAMQFLLTDEGLKKAVQEGLFSGENEESRLVAASDKILIKKYEALRSYEHKHTNINAIQTVRTWRDNLDTWHTRRSQGRQIRRGSKGRVGWTSARTVPSIRIPMSGSQMLMIKIADFLMWDQGLGLGRWPEIMDLTGRLKKDHPLVQEHGFKLPDFTPVLVYQNIQRQRPDCSAMLDRLPDMRVAMPGENLPNMMLFMLRRKYCLLSLLGRSR